MTTSVKENNFPHFMIIGAVKCGTTSLYRTLKSHPQVFMPEIKEINFFNKDERFQHGENWYFSLFNSAPKYTLRGEASATYSLLGVYPKTAERMSKYLPQAKLIYIVRDPAEQIVSHWLEEAKYRALAAPFSTAIRTDRRFIDACSYWKQISEYRRHFDDNQILVLFFEELISNPQRTLIECCNFLGIRFKEPGWEGRYPEENQTKHGDRPTLIADLLIRAKGYGRLRKLTPEPLKKRIRWMYRKPLPKKPVLSKHDIAFIQNRIRADAETFLAHYGRSTHIWPYLFESVSTTGNA